MGEALNVRRATIEDVDWLHFQLKKFSDFFGTQKPLKGDGVFAREFIENLVANHLVLIADQFPSKPIGLISGLILPHMYNPEIRVLSETFWWVDEEHRGSRAGLRLLEEFIDFGKKNADWITFALEDNSPVRDEVLTRRGFRLKEKSFLMEVS